MKSKRLFALLLSVLMVMAMLSGCGSQGETEPAPSGNDTTEEKVAVTVTVWGPQ